MKYTNPGRSLVRALKAILSAAYFLLDNNHRQVAITTRSAESSSPRRQNDLCPIYWINLDTSTSRRDAVLNSFTSLGIYSNHYRVPAYTNITAYEAWNSGRLVLHPKIKLEAKTEYPATLSKHINHRYHYEEAACLLSHLRAIKNAYNAGHEVALILEDDALMSASFQQQWRGYVKEGAPLGWKILQFATMMPKVMKQGIHLHDPFVSWQPYHWSTRAYMINRAGMQTVMEKAYSTSESMGGEDVWSVVLEAPMVVSDEAIYTLVGDAYTSTRLWIDSFDNVDSTIQSNEVNSDIMHSYSSITSNRDNVINHHLRADRADDTMIFEESLLVLMNVRIREAKGLKREIERIKQDSHDVCKFHRTCKWKVNVVVVHQDMLAFVQKYAASELSGTSESPSNVETLITLSTQPFNKFAFVEKSIPLMAGYDFVLLKDNDQRISGFPWRTFVLQKKNAIVSGPLRQSAHEALLGMAMEKSNMELQHFQFHEAHEWFHYDWSSRLITEVVPTEVPLLEMYFTLFDAEFAAYFFRQVLSPEFIGGSNSWGPDYLWCQAAREWDNGGGRPGCYLVPLVSSHENSHQIEKGDAFVAKGHENMNRFKNHPKFGKWMKAAFAWNRIVGAKNLLQIERDCRGKLKLKKADSFDVQSCSMLAMK